MAPIRIFKLLPQTHRQKNYVDVKFPQKNMLRVTARVSDGLRERFGDLVLSECEPNLLVGDIEDGVVLAHEDISQDPEGAKGLLHVQAHDAEDAQGAVGDEIVLGAERVDRTIDGELEVGATVVALQSVLSSDNFACAEELGDFSHSVRGACEDRCARVLK